MIKETENLINTRYINDIENFPKGKVQAQIASLANSIKHLRKKEKKTPPSLYKYSENVEPMSSVIFEASISLTLNPNKGISPPPKKLQFNTHHDAKDFNKILE